MKNWQKAMQRIKDRFSKKSTPQHEPLSSKQQPGKPWLDLQYHDANRTLIKKPNELDKELVDPPGPIDGILLDRIQGSMIGMAIGDALGAHVEFRPHQYLVENPVTDLEGGGTWGLVKGQFTDDTSMALCLANSLVAQGSFNLYDQLVRYKWWYKLGYMSSTGECFDIGAATSNSLKEFEKRQRNFAKDQKIPDKQMDTLSNPDLLNEFEVYCSFTGVAGNGALMRLAPVPLFFYRFPHYAVEYSGLSGLITHGDKKASDACRYYGALIVAALRGYTKDQLLDKEFYSKHIGWFGNEELCIDIRKIAEGSYRREGGYEDGIRGKGYIVDALEAALWAFWSDGDSFEKGALAAVNLGDDTDTTAAIYGQLAGAHYGYRNLPQHWLQHVYAKKFMCNLSKWIAYEGEMWQPTEGTSSVNPPLSYQPHLDQTIPETFTHESNSNIYNSQSEASVPQVIPPEHNEKMSAVKRPRSAKPGATSLQTPTKPAGSSATLTTNQDLFNPNQPNLNVISQTQSQKRTNEASLGKSTSNIYSSPTEEPAGLQNSSKIHGKPSQENSQHGSALRATLSSTDGYTLRTTTMNQRPLEKKQSESKPTFNVQRTEDSTRSSKTTTAPSKPSSQNLVRSRQSGAKKDSDNIVRDGSQGVRRANPSESSPKQPNDRNSTITASSSLTSQDARNSHGTQQQSVGSNYPGSTNIETKSKPPSSTRAAKNSAGLSQQPKSTKSIPSPDTSQRNPLKSQYSNGTSVSAKTVVNSRKAPNRFHDDT